MAKHPHRYTGKPLQEDVARQAASDPYKRLYLRQIPDPVIITKRHRGNNVSGFLGRPVGVDLEGRLCLGDRRGLVVAVECKSRESRPSLSFTLGQRLREHQGAYLAGVAADGGVAAVYVRFHDKHQPLAPGRDFLIPAGCQGVLHNATSVKWTALERWEVPRGRLWVEAVLSPSGSWRWERYCTGGGWEGLW